jgi:hypothetical protein
MWYWCEVAHWLYQNNLVKEEVLREAVEVDLVNNVLELTRQKAANPDLMEEVVRSLSPQICG